MSSYEVNRIFTKRKRIPYTFYANIQRTINRQISYGLNTQVLYDSLPDLRTVDDIKLLDRKLDRVFRRTKFHRYLPEY